MDTNRKDRKIHKIALLVALACVLQISESMIPHPIPGLRLGLANMLTLTAMVMLGFRCALEVAILRVVLSSFLMGTFMSPAFILSFCGALVSTLVMGFLYWMSGLSRHIRMSMIGISIAGALAHNMVQLYMAYLLLIKHSGIFAFLPWLSLGAIGTGWLVGVVAGGVCQRLQNPPARASHHDISTPDPDSQGRQFSPGVSWLHRMRAESKLAALFAMSLTILISANAVVLAAAFSILTAIIITSRTPPAFCFSVVRRYRFFLLISFGLPLLFTSGDRILLDMGLFKISEPGLRLGTLFSARIFLLILASALLMRSTAPVQLAKGLRRLLRPLKNIGISSDRVAEILLLAWTAFPRVWEMVRTTILTAKLGHKKNLRNLLPALTTVIADLYLQTEKSHGTGNRTVIYAQGGIQESGCAEASGKQMN